MEQDYVALDLETTGLSPKKDKIIEIGALRVRNGEAAESFTTLVKPGCRLPELVVELTGIREEMLDGPGVMEAPEAVSKLLSFIGRLPLVGHRILFDFSFVKRQAVNLGFAFEARGADTLKLSRKYLPELPSKTLDSLCGYYSIDRNISHRALEDAVAAHSLYQILSRQFETEENREDFLAGELVYQVKKEGPASKRQKEYLKKLIQYYHLEPGYDPELLTKNEASRFTDLILCNHGKIPE